jgi:uncharacterized protein (TIGR00251 family)
MCGRRRLDKPMMLKTNRDGRVVAMGQPQNDCRIALAKSQTGVCLRVEVVPGASRTRLVGLLGDHLKIAVAAPPHAGQANKMLCKLLADVLQISTWAVTVIVGHTQPKKTIAIADLDVETTARQLSKKISATIK